MYWANFPKYSSKLCSLACRKVFQSHAIETLPNRTAARKSLVFIVSVCFQSSLYFVEGYEKFEQQKSGNDGQGSKANFKW